MKRPLKNRRKPVMQEKFSVYFRKLKLCVFFVVGLSFLVGLYWTSTIVQWPNIANLLPVESVKVVGDYQYLDINTINTITGPYVKHGIAQVNVHELRNRIKENPWVRDVTVRRVWPDILVLNISEHKIIARWKDTQYLTDEGLIIFPDRSVDIMGLPVLSGQNVGGETLLNQYKIFQEAFSKVGLVIGKLSLNSRGAWDVSLAKGFDVKLGKRDIKNRIARFVNNYEQVFKLNLDKLDIVDLRYIHGFSIAWKDVSKANDLNQNSLDKMES